MGIVFLAVGLGVGYLMISQPQGLNPSWPLGAAMLVPAVFAAGGLHMVASGLGFAGVSAAMLKVIMVCFWAIANWAAFFSARVPCRQTASFFGVPLLARIPSEAECRDSLRVIVGSLDAIVAAFLIAIVWRRLRSRRAESGR
jgi:hypothetical protein